MPDTSPRLSLPMILPAQAQKHVTHNDALTRLDALVQMVLQQVAADTPPGAATEGETWGIGAAPTDAWEGHAGQIASFQNGGWLFLTPQAGWLAWDTQTGQISVYTGSNWAPVGSGGGAPTLQNLPGVGIGTTSDATNRLSISADATLLNNAGSGHQLKINKDSAGDTASLLFQTGFSGRAEMGTAGNDDFAIKVSGDGSSFTTGLTLKAGSGIAQVQAVSGAPVMVADDAAVLIPCPSIAGFVLMGVTGSDPRADLSAILVQDTGSTPGLQELFSTTDVDALGTGVLSGTTGTDGKLSISAVTGGLWVENRTGSAQSVNLTFLGGL